MKIVAFFLIFFFTIGVFLYAQGYYPVALVERAPIFYRTWEKAQNSAMHYTNVQRVSGGGSAINYHARENEELLAHIKKSTLTFLIEDAVIVQEGPNVDDVFRAVARERAEGALSSSPSLAQGAEKLYGLSRDDFRELVLFPQARRDVLRDHFQARDVDPEVWLRDIKKQKRVRLFFVPYTWNGEVVE